MEPVIDVLLIGACIAGIKKIRTFDRDRLKKKIKRIMVGANVKNHTDQYPELLKYIEKQYGYDFLLSIPEGCSFEQIEKVAPHIEAALAAEVDMTWKKFENCVYVKASNKPLAEKKFTMVETKPFELYLGYDIYGNDCVIDLNKQGDVLITGSIGAGKSRLLYVPLTNLAAQYGVEEVEFYLTQLEKCDLAVLKNVENTRYFAEDIKSALKMFRYLRRVVHERNALFKAHLDEDILDIKDWNRIKINFPLSNKILIIDEFSLYMPSENDPEKDEKKECLDCIEDIIKLGRSAGVFVILGLQRPDYTQLPPFFKSQMNTRISLRVINKWNAKMVLDDTEEAKAAVGLPIGEAIVITTHQHHIKTPYIDTRVIKENLFTKIERFHKMENIDPPPPPKKEFAPEVPPGQLPRGKKKDLDVIG